MSEDEGRDEAKVDWIPMPEVPAFNHDMLQGPCSCGATHSLEDWTEPLLILALQSERRLREKAEAERDALRDQYELCGSTKATEARKFMAPPVRIEDEEGNPV